MRLALIGLLTVVVMLLMRQQTLIYFPHPYGRSYAARLPRQAMELRFRTSQGGQVSFFLPPKNGRVPDKIWAMFSGNGSVALDWTDFVARCPRTGDGFLLVEYPGYGRSEGRPSPASIEEAGEKALESLATAAHLPGEEIEQKLNVLGHSIGCGAALNLAAHHPVQRIILLAPFTSLREMARRVVGFPLCYLLLHNFDNCARLRELAARPTPPQITIFHGSDDEVIPFAMGEKLAGCAPRVATFVEVAGADHTSVLFFAEEKIFDAMSR